MSHHRSDSTGAGSASDKDVLIGPSAQLTPVSPSQTTLLNQGSPKENALSEKYKKLKRRFFELEEKHKETSTELQRSSERNVRMREERNMLLDRIIELEAQSQVQSDSNGSPTSPSFPRTLMNARAHTSFVENLRQVLAEDDVDDDMDAVSGSRHLDTQTQKKTDDKRGEDEAGEAKSPNRQAHTSHPLSESPKAKESPTSVLAPAMPSPTRTPEEAYQISDSLSDVTGLEREAFAASPENQSMPFTGSSGPSMPPTQLETPRQSPVLKSVDMSHADSPNVDQQTNQASPNGMTSLDDAITDVAMADGTSHEASGHDDRLPIDKMNNEAIASNGASLNVATQAVPGEEQPIDKENVRAVPGVGLTTPQGKARGKKAPARSTKTKGGKKNASTRVEPEQSGSPQASRRSARLARNAEVVAENEVGVQLILPVAPGLSAPSPKGSMNTSSVQPGAPRMVHQKPGLRMLSPSLVSESHFSVSTSGSPPPPSEPVTEAPSPTTSRHTLDLIDPLLKPTGAASSTDLAATCHSTPSPSMDNSNIVRVATAVIAAQNAARQGSDASTEDGTSPSSSSIQAQGTNSEVATAATTKCGLPSPSPISSNPYLALSAVKPDGSPVGMPPMMPPMNPYTMYYPAPSTPSAPPYPYANPYYYISPMAGPSTIYSPPPSVDPPSPNVPRSPPDSQRQTKPKRLKAHTVTSKQFSIPMVPRDKNGKPMLPLNVGIMTVINLGTVCMREHFHTERYIFPVGYEVTRRYMSTVDRNHDVVYHCTILDGGDGPKFQIIPGDSPDRPVIAGTATGAWSAIVKQANTIRNRQHSNSVSGPDFFGLGQNTIKHLIQQLPNADRLKDYVWQHFVEGGPLGGRHAAVIPALPDEYESILPIGALKYQDKQRPVPPPDPSRGLSYYPQHIIQQAQQERQQQEQRQQSQQVSQQ